MKTSIIIILLTITTFSWTNACDIKFGISGEKKSIYTSGDEVIIEVSVKLTHRVCQQEIIQTKFTYEGMKILSATEWKETQPGTYVRKIKAKILADQKEEAKLVASRKCDKEGGYGVFKLKKQKA